LIEGRLHKGYFFLEFSRFGKKVCEILLDFQPVVDLTVLVLEKQRAMVLGDERSQPTEGFKELCARWTWFVIES